MWRERYMSLNHLVEYHPHLRDTGDTFDYVLGCSYIEICEKEQSRNIPVTSI